MNNIYLYIDFFLIQSLNLPVLFSIITLNRINHFYFNKKKKIKTILNKKKKVRTFFLLKIFFTMGIKSNFYFIYIIIIVTKN